MMRASGLDDVKDGPKGRRRAAGQGPVLESVKAGGKLAAMRFKRKLAGAPSIPLEPSWPHCAGHPETSPVRKRGSATPMLARPVLLGPRHKAGDDETGGASPSPYSVGSPGRGS